MKRVIAAQTMMSNGKTIYSGLFDAEGDPVDIELECEDGKVLMSVVCECETADDDDDDPETAVLTREEKDRICALYDDCDDCPLNDLCEEGEE
ncbi:MAG: hypothetical protein IIZ73_10720 [Ruminococcus sp.]|nr:hypothetical protein [Ruminococcus sp.]